MFNTRIILKERPSGKVTESNMAVETAPVPDLQEGEVLVQNEYISIDPAMRGWMNEGTTYMPGVAIGSVMRGFAVGVVIESRHAEFKPGDLVQGLTGVQQYAVANSSKLQKINSSLFPPSWYLGVLGMPGLTAYFGLLDKGKPLPGETVLVSAAAGMVGSMVGQIALLKGCTVIGIAGGAEKCSYVTNELGFHHCIDYKKGNISALLRQVVPTGVHVYFDNVGGDLLDAALLNLAMGARVVICGAIAQYNDDHFNGLKNYMKIVTARGSISGIIVFDYFSRSAEAISDISEWLQLGKIKYREHIVDGIDNYVPALDMLFTGKNIGKLVLKV